MTMKATYLVSLLAVMFLVPLANAGLVLSELPNNYLDEYAGRSSYYLNLGGGQILHGHIEFAVYDTQTAGDLGFSVPGDRRYVYAYQVFNTGSNATAAVSYFGLAGVNPNAIASINDIDTAQNSSDGQDADASYFNLSKTKAIFEFENGAFIVGEKSFFLLIGSDYTPVVGVYELVSSLDDDDIVVPGDDADNGNPVPEPATMAILLGGALLGLRKRK